MLAWDDLQPDSRWRRDKRKNKTKLSSLSNLLKRRTLGKAWRWVRKRIRQRTCRSRPRVLRNVDRVILETAVTHPPAAVAKKEATGNHFVLLWGLQRFSDRKSQNWVKKTSASAVSSLQLNQLVLVLFIFMFFFHIISCYFYLTLSAVQAASILIHYKAI